MLPFAINNFESKGQQSAHLCWKIPDYQKKSVSESSLYVSREKFLLFLHFFMYIQKETSRDNWWCCIYKTNRAEMNFNDF